MLYECHQRIFHVKMFLQITSYKDVTISYYKWKCYVMLQQVDVTLR